MSKGEKIWKGSGFLKKSDIHVDLNMLVNLGTWLKIMAHSLPTDINTEPNQYSVKDRHNPEIHLKDLYLRLITHKHTIMKYKPGSPFLSEKNSVKPSPRNVVQWM